MTHVLFNNILNLRLTHVSLNDYSSMTSLNHMSLVENEAFDNTLLSIASSRIPSINLLHMICRASQNSLVEFHLIWLISTILSLNSHMASQKEYFPSFPLITPMLEQYHEFYNFGVNRGPQKCCFSNEMRGITFLIMSLIQKYT